MYLSTAEYGKNYRSVRMLARTGATRRRAAPFDRARDAHSTRFVYSKESWVAQDVAVVEHEKLKNSEVPSATWLNILYISILI